MIKCHYRLGTRQKNLGLLFFVYMFCITFVCPSFVQAISDERRGRTDFKPTKNRGSTCFANCFVMLFCVSGLALFVLLVVC